MRAKSQLTLVALALALTMLASAGVTQSATPTPLNGKSGIDVTFPNAVQGRDYAVEQLYHDPLYDDRSVVYIKQSTPINLAHNANNIDPKGNVIGAGGNGIIRYKIDGDELWEGESGRGNAQPYAETANDYTTHPTVRKYTGAFSLAGLGVAGKVGDNGLAQTNWNHYHNGTLDAFGEEWHTLTYWDDDSLWFNGTIAGGTTSVKFENTSDGKIVQLVVNPKAPVISFQASGGDQYYTTPAKTYYIPKIHEQKTYISSGAVKVVLTNLYDSQPVYYRVAGGSWQSLTSGQGPDFNSMYSASKGGTPQANTEYLVEYKNGSTGKVKTRKIHVAPSSPGAKEKNGKFFWKNQAEKDAVKSRLARAPYSSAYGSLKTSNTYTKADLNFRSGTRYWNVSGAGGWRSHRQVGYAAVNNGFVAAIEGYAYSNYAYANRAKQALLASFTVDPIGDESPMAVAYSAPSQDRVYYGFERRMHIAFPAGYDLMAGYTTANGYAQGFTPIEELKARDNLGSEALQLLHRHDSERARANWMVGNDLSLAAFAMAMPTYNTPQYGTAGADSAAAGYSGPTPASYYDTPFPGQKVTWWDASTNPNVPRGSFPNLVNGPSLFTYHSPSDGYWKEGHLGQYNQQLVPYITPLMNFRNNFDGGRYEHLEDHATGVVHNRHPQNGKSLASANGNSERNDSVLGLINPRFPKAGLYRWHLDTPSTVATNYSTAVSNDYNLAYNLAFFDDTVPAQPPAKDLKADNTFTSISDPNSTKGIFGRLQAQDFNDINIRWVGQATDFMIDAFGEHLLVRPGSGMSGLPVYAEGYNTVLVDDTDSNFNTGVTMGTKANIVRSFTPSYMSYAAVRTDSSGSYDTGHYKSKAIVNERHMLSPDKRFFILVDNLKSGSGSHTYGLTLHGSTNGNLSNMAVDDTNDIVTWTKPSGVKLRAQVVSPGVTISKYSGKSTITNYTEPYIIAKAGGTNLRFLTLLSPIDAGKAAPTVTKLNTSAVRAARIVDGGATYRVHTKDGTTAETVDGRYTSDAEIGLTKEAGGVFDYLLMVNGKTFSFAGTSYLTSANPISATLNKVSSGLNLKVEAGASGGASTNLTVGGLQPGSAYKLIEDGVLKANITADSAGKYTYTQDISRQHDMAFELGSGTVDNQAPVMGVTTAVADGTDRIKLSWTAATDESGISTYKIYRGTSQTNLAYIGQTSALEHTDLNLSASTTYYYQVEAVDNAGNSARGSIVSATTYSEVDQTSPAAPSGLTAVSASGSDAVKLTWQANSESDLAGYELYRDGAKLKTGLTGTSYTDSGLTTGHTYHYELAAIDDAGNVGARTTTVSATAGADRYEESAASGTGSWGIGGNNAFSAGKNIFSAVTGDKLTFNFSGTSVTWIATKYDQRGIAKVYLDGVYQGDVDLYAANPIQFQRAVWSKANLTSGNHTLEIIVSGSKHALSYSPRIDADAFDVVAGSTADVTPPTVTIAPFEPVITGQSKTFYGSAADDGSVDRVELAIKRSHDGAYWNGLDWSPLPVWNAVVGTGPAVDWTYTWLLPSSDGVVYTLEARATDAAGNIGRSPELAVTVDNIAPAVPSGLTAASASGSDAVKLTWQANSASDLAGYDLYRDGAKLKTGLTGTGYTDSGLTAGRTYYYELAAVDNAGNTGDKTTIASATAGTERYEETEATTAGSWDIGANEGLTAAKNLFSATTGGKVTFSFSGTAVTWIATKYDQRGIAKVYLDGVYQQDVDLYAAGPAKFQQAAWSKASLAPGNHTLEITVSGVKNPLSYTTRIDADAFDVAASEVDQIPPAAPSGLTAVSTSGSDAVKLTWQANSASDLAGYELYRDGAKLKTGLTGTGYTDSGLTTGRTYHYELAAIDSAGNVGARTTTVSATAGADRYEESVASAAGSWGVGVNDGMSAAKNFFSANTGDKLTFNFSGTAVTWIATKYDQRGIAKVYLDGVYQGDVDLYAANPIQFQQAVWSKANLTPGNHTLEITVSGSKHALSYSPRIDADAFDVVAGSTADVTPPRVVIGPVDPVITGQSKIFYGSASDDRSVDRVELAIKRSHDGAYWNGLGWSPVPAWNAVFGTGPTLNWAYTWLLPDSDGVVYTLEARATDAAGNIGRSPEVPVTVDNVAPSGTIAVNGGAAWTREPLVTIDNDIIGATRMSFSLDGGSTWSASEPFAAAKELALPAGDGIKTVVGEFKDDAGNTFKVADAIRLDTNAPARPTELTAAGQTDTDDITINWKPNNTDDLAWYNLYRDGVKVQKITSTSYVDVGLSRGHTYHYELAAVDFAGNVGPKTTIASATVRAERREETAATYKGGWSTGANNAFSGGENSFSSKSGDQITLDFNGTGVVWIATKRDQQGTGRVYLDGVYHGDVDLSGPPDDIRFQQAVWSKTDLAPGAHTLVIKVAPGKLKRIDVDAFDVIPTDTQAPIASLSAPGYATKKSSGAGFRIAWSTRDPAPSSGIREVYVQYKKGRTGGWDPWLRTSKKNNADFRGAPGRPYFFRVRAKDRAGNIGRWSKPKRVVVPFDESVFKFSRGWRRVASKTAYLGAERVGSAGKSAKFKFTGFRVALIGSRGPRHGRTRVFIDGRPRGIVSSYAPKSAKRRVLASFPLQSRGPHTIRLKNLATRNRPYFYLDGIAVLR